ncbi:hypothetical protein Trydic_g22800 [Trypoxylus dichotomus]
MVGHCMIYLLDKHICWDTAPFQTRYLSNSFSKALEMKHDKFVDSSKTSSQKKSWRKQPRSNSATSSVRRFNVTVVTSGPSDEGFAPPISPGPRHRGEQFASIPEDHVLEEPVQKHLSDSRAGSPAPSWDFSNDSDSVSIEITIVC